MTGKRDRLWVENPSTNVIDYAGAARSRAAQEARLLKKAKPGGKYRPYIADKFKRTRKIPDFYSSPQWITLRYQALKRDGARCLCCGRSAKDGVVMNVDHIKPRSAYPKLELRLDNLQVLCSRCNQGKGWRDQTDWH